MHGPAACASCMDQLHVLRVLIMWGFSSGVMTPCHGACTLDLLSTGSGGIERGLHVPLKRHHVWQYYFSSFLFLMCCCCRPS